MSKQEAYPTEENVPNSNKKVNNDNSLQEPLSGSKKVKNRNHSRANQHSEGTGHGG